MVRAFFALRPSALLLATAASVAAQGQRLNAPLVAGGAIIDFFASPDGSRVVYRADQEVDEQWELYTVSVEGGIPRRLNPALPASADIWLWRFSPDGRWVVYEVNSGTPGGFDLYSALADGSAPAARLNDFGLVTQGWRISGDSGHVVLQAFGGSQAIYATEIDGGTPAKKLSRFYSAILHSHLISPDSTTVVFFADNGLESELLSVPIDASLTPLSIGYSLDDHPLLLGIGGRAVHTGLEDTGIGDVLDSVPFDGCSSSVRLAECGDLSYLSSSARGRRIVYSSDVDFDGDLELSTVPPDGSAAPVQVVSGAPFRLSHDVDWRDRHVAYIEIGPPQRLMLAPIDGGSPIRLDDPTRGGGTLGQFRYSPLGGWLVFSADQETAGTMELFAVPRSGGLAPVRLSARMAPGGNVDYFEFSPDGDDLVYRADRDQDEVFELYRVPLRPPARRTHIRKVSGALTPGGDVHYFRLTRDAVLYVADQESDGVPGLFVTALTHIRSAR